VDWTHTAGEDLLPEEWSGRGHPNDLRK